MLRISERNFERDAEVCVRVCVFHRLAEGIWPSQLDQINADSKGNWYWLAWKKIY
jgi:hypothetical protein